MAVNLVIEKLNTDLAHAEPGDRYCATVKGIARTGGECVFARMPPIGAHLRQLDAAPTGLCRGGNSRIKVLKQPAAVVEEINAQTQCLIDKYRPEAFRPRVLGLRVILTPSSRRTRRPDRAFQTTDIARNSVMDPQLVAVIEDYARTHGLNLPPHEIVSDMVVDGPSEIEQLLAMLGVRINAGDPADNAQAQAGHAEGEARLMDAQMKFPANEEQSAARLAGVGGRDPMSEMSGLTQAASGIGQSIGSALSGMLQPFGQLGQQLPQAGMQAMQTGMGALQHSAGGAGGLLGAGGGLGGGAAELAGAAGGAGAGSAGTVPSAQLGPPPTPSANTVPASSPSTPVVSPASPDSASGPRGGMAGMPMVPPGAMQGPGGTGKDAKADTKRVVPPSVKNGAPIQGRIVAPPTAAEVVKRVEGQPVASRRIVMSDEKPNDDLGSSR